MKKELDKIEILDMLMEGVKLEYLDTDEQGEYWCILSKDSPIRLLWDYKIRIA